MTGKRIRHMVVFNLKHQPDSPETEKFLQDGRRILSAIETVENFEALRQVSPKCGFSFGFSMEFADEEAYDRYNNHPSHMEFVERRWKTEVTAFQEIDFKGL